MIVLPSRKRLLKNQLRALVKDASRLFEYA
jgi:hypothetical protein